ncbi:MAG TPA: GNAT family N-acetyltransferase [Ktedonobacteraceae bacterium]|nr:GNAT family N-acetyltransferase [Ktedonobacteraceae bacterium]
MQILIRPAERDDEPFLWEMLYYAAHMSEDGETDVGAARENAGLQKYVQGWGQANDIGVLALEEASQRPLGAAWMRVLQEEKKMSPLIPAGTPELAIAVLPDQLGRGIGTRLLETLLPAARQVYPAIVLSVRKDNPARHLYARMGFEVIDTGISRVGSESFVMLKRFTTIS